MDTKSKNFNDIFAVRLAAFLLCVATFTTSIVGIVLIGNANRELDYNGDLGDLLREGKYEDSSNFQMEYSNHVHSVLSLLKNYKSESYIKEGKAISEGEIDHIMQELYYNGTYVYENGNETTVISTDEDWHEKNDYRSFGEEGIREEFYAAHEEELEAVKKGIIASTLKDFERAKKELDRENGFSYYATDGKHAITNVKVAEGEAVKASTFKNHPAYLIYENREMSKIPEAPAQYARWDQMLDDELFSTWNDELKVYVSFDKSFMSAKSEAFNAMKKQVLMWIPMLLGAVLATLFLFVYLMIATGRRDENGQIKRYKLDSLFTELQIVIIILAIGLGISLVSDVFWHGYYFNGYIEDYGTYQIALSHVDLGLLAAAIAAIAMVGLWFILSCVRNLKAGTFIKSSLVYIVCNAIWRGIRSIFDRSNPMTKVVLIALAICLLSATVVLAPIMFALVIVFAPKWVQKYTNVKKGVEEVRHGNLSYQIPVKPSAHGEFDELARGINEISEASNIAIQNELKNQRLKTELISNVSHDLKTPLTSIITYVDLMKKEDLHNETADKYLEVLDQKSKRLQKLTEDLFDAAKASSGAIPVRMEKVDLLSLINQGLGEMGDGFKAQRLDVLLNAEAEKYYVHADGQLLWRIVENLLGNVQKYALEGSRVYIDVTERGLNEKGRAFTILEIKNVSRAPLNMHVDELMERFKRGDESRTTEGSGLGLAIAKDLAKLQNGWFELKIDGDLFKAILMLEPYENRVMSDSENATMETVPTVEANSEKDGEQSDEQVEASEEDQTHE